MSAPFGIPSRRCTTASDVPTDPHFAIIVFSTYYCTDEGNINLTEYTAYFDKGAWTEEVTRLAINKKDFISMFVNPAKTIVKVDVEISC